MVNGQLEDSLRREIEAYLEGRLSEIKQEVDTLQSQFSEALAKMLERQGDVQTEGSLTNAIAEHLRAAHERGIDLAVSESSRAKASSDMAIVKAAIIEINDQKSQAEILKTLVNRAASFAPRVAFFVVKGDQATGWRARGFEGTVGDSTVQQISVSVNADTVLGTVVKSLQTWSGGPGSHTEDHLLLNRLGEDPAQRIISIPLAVRDRAVAILYADSAGLDSEAINLEALETLVRVSAMAVELLSVSRGGVKRVVEQPQAAPEPEAQPAVEEPHPSYSPASEYEEPAPGVQEADVSTAPTSETLSYAPSSEPATSDASLTFDQETDSQPSTIFDDAKPAQPPTPANEQPVWQSESSPAWQAEPAPHAESSASAPTFGRRRYGQEAELPVEVTNDEERRLHNDARRFARLLISEIKLYNEQKVAEGRSEHDLYDRLREYIDRSREMYDKRVKAEVAARYDYFHGELVNTLAEGDESKLGSNYPGATVNA